ncbi:DEAD/DEAH box helicase [Paenibacillus humicola]|uniref:DEAD/DEAH box helicase n=1 Tax=Paenibacillus humicola TaxID=3110540 RepID=UPI00237B15DB|nr:DEAD/DEAH box helicase [Paenibacillus humicola]
MTWESLGIDARLAAALREHRIETPTPVQAEAIPALLGGRDISAKSQTGSGKTLAYLLPALQRIDSDSSRLQAMVLAPTQELAMQIFRVAEIYCPPLGLRAQPLIGGASMQRQVEKLRQHPHIVIGTPGRIHELAAAGKLRLHHIRVLVIDEADQVFSLGSGREVETLLKGMVRDRQVAFFSATRPQTMADVERKWMTNPERIDVTAEPGAGSNVEHFYLVCDKRDKVDTARRLMRLMNPASALAFINDTDEIANYEAKFGYEGFAVETLYGDADKQRRAATLTRFRDGRCRLLLATDVAARGLDIENLPLVLHLDPALDADIYVHRSGRTGRMGRPGTVVSIVTPQQLFIMDKFARQLGIPIIQKAMYRGRLWNPDELQTGRGGRHISLAKTKESPSGMDGRTDQAGVRGPESGSSHRSTRIDETSKPGYNSDNNGTRPGAGKKRARRMPASSPSVAAGGEPSVGPQPSAGAGGRHDGQSTGRTERRASGKPAASKPEARKTTKKRERDNKDKGAPKWLKAKREEQRKP